MIFKDEANFRAMNSIAGEEEKRLTETEDSPSSKKVIPQSENFLRANALKIGRLLAQLAGQLVADSEVERRGWISIRAAKHLSNSNVWVLLTLLSNT